jgi:hypothetical protein
MRFGATDEQCVRDLKFFRSKPLAAKAVCCGILLCPVFFSLSVCLCRGVEDTICYSALAILSLFVAALFVANYARGITAEERGIQPAPPAKTSLNRSIWLVCLGVWSIVTALRILTLNYEQALHPRWREGGGTPGLCFDVGMLLFFVAIGLRVPITQSNV